MKYLLLLLLLIAAFSGEGQAKDLSDLLAPYKGNVVYVDFWATWCGHCLDEMNDREQWLQQHYARKKVKFVFISMDESKDTAKAMEIIRSRHIKGVQFFSLNFQMDKWPEFLPTYMLFDKNGKLMNADAKCPSQTPEIYLQIDSLL